MAALALLRLYSAQIAGYLPSDEEYLGEDTSEVAPKLAKEIAIIMRVWEETGQLADEGVEILATSWAKLGIPSVKKSARTPPPITEFAYSGLAPMALKP